MLDAFAQEQSCRFPPAEDGGQPLNSRPHRAGRCQRAVVSGVARSGGRPAGTRL
jgi:hypothetical protein